MFMFESTFLLIQLAHQYLKKMKNPINEIYLKTYEIFYSLWIK